MYQLTKSVNRFGVRVSFPDGVIRLSDNAAIPFEPTNRDYREYLAWVAAGGVPIPVVGA